MTKPSVEIGNLSFRYPRSDFQLRIEQLEIGAGERVAIVGPSGSGKTTLLNLIAGITVPDSGTVTVAGKAVSAMSDARRRDFRISHIGMVFQQFELVEYLNCRDNVELPFMINRSLATSEAPAKTLLDQVGLADKIRRYPAQLSQGEQQRVAICRALVARPELILADEPTGNLDPANKKKILELIFDQCKQRNLTLIAVTHDQNILDGFDRTIDFAKFCTSERD